MQLQVGRRALRARAHQHHEGQRARRPHAIRARHLLTPARTRAQTLSGLPSGRGDAPRTSSDLGRGTEAQKTFFAKAGGCRVAEGVARARACGRERVRGIGVGPGTQLGQQWAAVCWHCLRELGLAPLRPKTARCATYPRRLFPICHCLVGHPRS